MLLQQVGGLPLQVTYTAEALNRLGHDAHLFDWRSDRLLDFDVIHVFSVINGNHRLVDFAKALGCAVVLSTVLHPPWTRRQGQVADFIDRLVGRVTSWQVTTSFGQIRLGLDRADAVVALGAREREMLVKGYQSSSDKIYVVPNGIDEGFFSASGEEFRAEQALDGDYALMVGDIGPYKNQLAAIKALRGSMPLVMFGSCPVRNKPYLDDVIRAGDGAAIYAGILENKASLFASAYAGASVFMLPSRTEVQPISALESLAAGTPVVLTRNNSLDLDLSSDCCREVDPDDVEGIRRAAIELGRRKMEVSRQCKDAVTHLKWSAVAESLSKIYEVAVARSRSA